ncbi:hypothetical protein PCC7424_2423 [Gloeothece citriformis PCC 7424]|uniref:Uncharacterized protein n=1 Tax=Gloeothece citriformis (strain PCC 7424) TaxID=65393 RepID=B7KJ08_GLOC7|nr:hypothetical protein [Gloeothece citriformis]ACK70844.1 hypothetical protein PCC7424_2423 [Gloeothece citriformis PCC 7424]
MYSNDNSFDSTSDWNNPNFDISNVYPESGDWNTSMSEFHEREGNWDSSMSESIQRDADWNSWMSDYCAEQGDYNGASSYVEMAADGYEMLNLMLIVPLMNIAKRNLTLMPLSMTIALRIPILIVPIFKH